MFLIERIREVNEAAPEGTPWGGLLPLHLAYALWILTLAKVRRMAL